MLLQIFGFLHLSFTDILDIILLGLIIFVAFKWLRGTSAFSIFIAIISLYMIRIIAVLLNMQLISAVMGTVLDVGMLAIIVIFQPEIRRFLTNLGNKYQSMNKEKNFIAKYFTGKTANVDSDAVNEICEACKAMGEEKTGALIVIANNASLENIVSTGDVINANIHRRLLMNLFFKNSPLHDGALIIHNNRIEAARCTLPITEKTNIPAHYGMRHKAGIGLSEVTDADVVVVSEETGNISYIKHGRITTIQNINELKLLLSKNIEG